MAQREKRKSERLGALFHYLRMNADKPVDISRLAAALSSYYLNSNTEASKRPRKLRDTLHRDIEAFLAAGVVISRNGEQITYHSPAHLNVNLDQEAKSLLADLAACLPSSHLSPLLSFALANERLRVHDSHLDEEEGDERAERRDGLYGRGKVRLGIPPGAHSLAMVSAVAHHILCVVTYHGHRYYLVPFGLTRAYKALYVQAWALPLATGKDAPSPRELPPLNDGAWMSRTFRIDRIDAVRMVELYAGDVPEVGESFAFSTDVTLAYHPREESSDLRPPLLLRAEHTAGSEIHPCTYRLKNIETNFLLEELVAYRGEVTVAGPDSLKRQLQENRRLLKHCAARSAKLDTELSHAFEPYHRPTPQAARIAPFYKALELIGYVSAHGAIDLRSLGQWAGLPWKRAAAFLIEAALIDDAEHYIPFELNLPSLVLEELRADSIVSISFPQDVSLPVRAEEVVLLLNVIDAALEIEGRQQARGQLLSLRTTFTDALQGADMEALLWPAPTPVAGTKVLADLAHALEQDHEVSFHYLRMGETVPEYSLEKIAPGMIEVGPRAYLLGLKDGQFRRYRLDRITDLHIEGRCLSRVRRALSHARKHAHEGLATYPKFHVEGEEVSVLLKPQGFWLLDTLADVSTAESGASLDLAHALPASFITNEQAQRAQLVRFKARSLSWLASVLLQGGSAVAYLGPAPVAERMKDFLAGLVLIEESE